MTSVKVAVRVRPLSERESNLGSSVVVDVCGKDILVTDVKVPISRGCDHRVRVHRFTFDYGFWSVDPESKKCATQETVYEEFGRVVLDTLLEGYNSCVIAYGPSGSGKTYTMMGSKDETGLTPRICEGLFKKLTDPAADNLPFQIDISFMEIYNEQVYDLLQKYETGRHRKSKLRVREHPVHGPFVEGLSTHIVRNIDKVCELLATGNDNRMKAATHVHDRSTRSHAIFTIHCSQAHLDESKPKEVISKLHLVDLAGSEKAVPEFCPSRVKEGGNINKSLVTLGNVISVLVEMSLHSKTGNATHKQAYVPYRDSNLTWLLKDSLGGNSHTFMLAAISPSMECYIDTVSTLRYAQRAKFVLNRPVVNEDPGTEMIRNLQMEVSKLKNLLATADKLNRAYVMKPLPDIVKLRKVMEESAKRVDVLTKHWYEKWLTTYDVVMNNVLEQDSKASYKNVPDFKMKEEVAKSYSFQQATTNELQWSNTSMSDSSSHCIIQSNEIVRFSKKKHGQSIMNCDQAKSKIKRNLGLNGGVSFSNWLLDTTGHLKNAYLRRKAPHVLNKFSACSDTNVNGISVRPPSPFPRSLSDANIKYSSCNLAWLEGTIENETGDYKSLMMSNSSQKEFDFISIIKHGEPSEKCELLSHAVIAAFEIEEHGVCDNIKKASNSEVIPNENNICNEELGETFNFRDKLLMEHEKVLQMVTNESGTDNPFLVENDAPAGVVSHMQSKELTFSERLFEESKNFVELLKTMGHESTESSSRGCSPKRKDSEIMSLLSFSSLDVPLFNSLDELNSYEEMVSEKSREKHEDTLVECANPIRTCVSLNSGKINVECPFHHQNHLCAFSSSSGHVSQNPYAWSTENFGFKQVANNSKSSLFTEGEDFVCFKKGNEPLINKTANSKNANKFDLKHISVIKKINNNSPYSNVEPVKAFVDEEIESKNISNGSKKTTVMSEMPKEFFNIIECRVGSSLNKTVNEPENFLSQEQQLKLTRYNLERLAEELENKSDNKPVDYINACMAYTDNVTDYNVNERAIEKSERIFQKELHELEDSYENTGKDKKLDRVHCTDDASLDAEIWKDTPLIFNVSGNSSTFLRENNLKEIATSSKENSAENAEDVRGIVKKRMQKVENEMRKIEELLLSIKLDDEQLRSEFDNADYSTCAEIPDSRNLFPDKYGSVFCESDLRNFRKKSCDTIESLGEQIRSTSSEPNDRESQGNSPVNGNDCRSSSHCDSISSLLERTNRGIQELKSEDELEEHIVINKSNGINQEIKSWAKKHLDECVPNPINVPTSGRIVSWTTGNSNFKGFEFSTEQGRISNSMQENGMPLKHTEQSCNLVKPVSLITCSDCSSSTDSITYVFVGKHEETHGENIVSNSSQCPSIISSLSLDSLERSFTHPKSYPKSPRTLSIDSLVAEELLDKLRRSGLPPPAEQKCELRDTSKQILIGNAVVSPWVLDSHNSGKNCDEDAVGEVLRSRKQINLPEGKSIFTNLKYGTESKKYVKELTIDQENSRGSDPTITAEVSEYFLQDSEQKLNPLLKVDGNILQSNSENCSSKSNTSTCSNHLEETFQSILIPPPCSFAKLEFPMYESTKHDCSSNVSAKKFNKSTQTQDLQDEKAVAETMGDSPLVYIDLTLHVIELLTETIKCLKESKSKRANCCLLQHRSERKVRKHVQPNICNASYSERQGNCCSSSDDLQNCKMPVFRQGAFRSPHRRITHSYSKSLAKQLHDSEVNKKLPSCNQQKHRRKWNILRKAKYQEANKKNLCRFALDDKSLRNYHSQNGMLSGDKAASTSIKEHRFGTNGIHCSNNESPNMLSFSHMRPYEIQIHNSGINDVSPPLYLTSFQEVSHGNPENYKQQLLGIRRRVVRETKNVNCEDGRNDEVFWENANSDLKNARQDMIETRFISSSSEGYLSSVSSFGDRNQHSGLEMDSGIVKSAFRRVAALKQNKIKPLLGVQGGRNYPGTPSTSWQNTSADSGAFFLDSPLTEKTDFLDFSNSVANKEKQVESLHLKSSSPSEDGLVDVMKTSGISNAHRSSKLARTECGLKSMNGTNKHQTLLLSDEGKGDKHGRPNIRFLRDFQNEKLNAPSSIEVTPFFKQAETTDSSMKRNYIQSSTRKDLVQKLSDVNYKITRQDIECALASIEADKKFLRRRRNIILHQRFSPEMKLVSSSDKSHVLTPWDSYKCLPDPTLYIRMNTDNCSGVTS